MLWEPGKRSAGRGKDCAVDGNGDDDAYQHKLLLIPHQVGSILESFKAGAVLPSSLDPIFAFKAEQVANLASLKFFVLLLLLTVSATSFSLCARLLVCAPPFLPPSLLLLPSLAVVLPDSSVHLSVRSAITESIILLAGVIANGDSGPEKLSLPVLADARRLCACSSKGRARHPRLHRQREAHDNEGRENLVAGPPVPLLPPACGLLADLRGPWAAGGLLLPPDMAAEHRSAALHAAPEGSLFPPAFLEPPLLYSTGPNYILPAWTRAGLPDPGGQRKHNSASTAHSPGPRPHSNASCSSSTRDEQRQCRNKGGVGNEMTKAMSVMRGDRCSGVLHPPHKGLTDLQTRLSGLIDGQLDGLDGLRCFSSFTYEDKHILLLQRLWIYLTRAATGRSCDLMMPPL